MSKQGMRVVALISGGKDSCYNMMECVKNGHQIVGLANLQPEVQGEMDSFMYQTVGQEGISLYAEAMGLPLFRRTIKGSSRCTEMNYTQSDEDEVEDLYHLLAEIKQSLEFDAVSSGAILSNYQRIRVENVCARLQLVSLAYMWRRNQRELLEEMVNNQVHAILVKTAALGLKPNHLGKSLQQMQPHLIKLNELYDCHICGEGGEFETFTLDCPLFKKKISITKSEVVSHSSDDVAYLHLQELSLEDKPLADGEKIVKEQLKKEDNFVEVVKHVEEQVTECPVEWIFDTKKSNHITTDSVSVSENGQFLSLSASINHENDLSDEEIVDATNKLLQSVSNALESHRHDRSSVTYVHLYLQSMKHFACINSAYIKFFTTSPPARVCVCTDFNQREDEMGILLKFDCISNKESSKREAMHVQSISYWAPSNIGPYSQCVRQDKMLCVAGQIGFIPEKMTIESGEVADEARLSLQHVQSVLDVMKSNLALVESCVCYVTRTNYFQVAAQVLFAQEPTLKEAGELLFVQISTLPRNARVEWQMISKEQNIGDEEDDEISMEFHSFYHASCDKDLVAVEVFTSLLESLRAKLLRRCDGDYVISSQARLFFVGGNMPCDDADNIGRLALNATFPDENCGNRKVAVSPPNLITIPVKSIWKPGCKQRPLVAVLKCIVNYRSQS